MIKIKGERKAFLKKIKIHDIYSNSAQGIYKIFISFIYMSFIKRFLRNELVMSVDRG